MVLKTRSCAGLRAICLVESKLFHIMELCQKLKLFPVEYRRDPYWVYCSLPYLYTISMKIYDNVKWSYILDDSVLYVGGKTCDVIKKFNSDLEQIANWFAQNNLVADLKKTKTECVLYGTHQRTLGCNPTEVKVNQTNQTYTNV